MIFLQNSFFLVLFTSLLSGLILYSFGNKIGFLKVYIIFFLHFFLSLSDLCNHLLFLINTHAIIDIQLSNVVLFENYNISLVFLIDLLTTLMLLIVIFITFFVSLFSIWYMKGDPNHLKFLSYLNFFMFFMILLVSSSNLIVVFVGWEGIGFFSYLLINFWDTRLTANRSAIKAIIVNRFGDIFLIAFISLFFYIFENFEESSKVINFAFYKTKYKIILKLDIYTIMSVCLFVSSVAKSAQFLMHVWLPDAMEGPTPVSSLLHAATMVTAGAFVIIKFNWIFLNTEFLIFILFVGIATNLISSAIAFVSFDLKKVIAYSTASQMGLIFTSIALIKPYLAFFHLFNHAFFKALLFILAGVLIYFLRDKQDIRNITSIKKEKFFIYSSFFIALLTLSGAPFLSAYYSKELIIKSGFGNYIVSQSYINYFLFFSIFTTVFYALRILNFLKGVEHFWIKPKIVNFFIKNNIPFFLKITIYVLIFFSVYTGFLLFDLFAYTDIFFKSVKINSLYVEKNKDFIHKIYFPFFTILFIIAFSFIYEKPFKKVNYYNLKYTKYKIFSNLIVKKFYFDLIYYYIVKFMYKIRFFTKEEKKFLENFVFNYLKKKGETFADWKCIVENDPIFLSIFIIFIFIDCILIFYFKILFFVAVLAVLFMFNFLITFFEIKKIQIQNE